MASSSYIITIHNDRIVASYRDGNETKLRVIANSRDYEAFMLDETKRLGRQPEIFKSSSLDFPAEFTDSRETIALAKELR